MYFERSSSKSTGASTSRMRPFGGMSLSEPPRKKTPPPGRFPGPSLVPLPPRVPLQLGAGFPPDELLHDRVLGVLDAARWANPPDPPLVNLPPPAAPPKDLGNLVPPHPRRE